MELVRHLYGATQSFPREEMFGLTSQMRRAAVSVPSNIAEGQTREHTREYLQHLSVAQGSVAELETQVEIAAQLGYLNQVEAQALDERLASVGKQLYALRNALSRSLADPRPPTPDP